MRSITNDSAVARQSPATRLETLARRVRMNPVLSNTTAVWDCLRPVYDRVSEMMYPNGIAWTINGTDELILSPRIREVSHAHEPYLWQVLTKEIRPQDVIVDVGANIGLYAVALAKRMGAVGQVYAFEPDQKNHRLLVRHIFLNNVGESVSPVRAAVGATDGTVPFASGEGPYSHVDRSKVASSVPCIRLDSFFAGRAVSIVKIDVEGFEEEVLKGAESILSQADRKPRLVYVELHPWAWERAGLSTRAETIPSVLRSFGYTIELTGNEPGGVIGRI